MFADLFGSLAFLGDFHPLIVHFPIALLPTVLLLKLYGRRTREPWVTRAVNNLLLLALITTLLAIALGLTNRAVNNIEGEALSSHLWLGVSSLALLVLTTLLHLREAQIQAWLQHHRTALPALGRALWITVGIAARLVKWVLIVLLFPVVLLLLLLRALYRRSLKKRLQPVLGKAKQKLGAGARAAGERTVSAARRINTLAVWKNASFGATLVLVLLTGLRGADLSHGEGHLTRNMPPALAALLGAGADLEANRQLDQAYYEKKVLPVLRRSCIKCHGEDKQRAGLRLDSYAALIESGVIRWQDPYGSELIRRILLPRDSAAAMPPREKSRELRSDDITALVNWIKGHTLESLARQDAGLPENLRAVADTLELVEDEELGALNALEGISVMRLVKDYDLLAVNLSFVPASKLDEALARLQPYAAHIVDLDLSGTDLTPEQWQRIAGMKNLQRLNLSRSAVSDGDLRRLAPLQRLNWLNVYGTEISLGAAELRAQWPSIKSLYLPQTPEVSGDDYVHQAG